LRELLTRLGTSILLLSAMATVAVSVACRGKMPSSSGPFPAPSGGPTSPLGTSLPPGPPTSTLQGKILLLLRPADSNTRPTLEISGPDGKGRQLLAEMSMDPGPVAVGPDAEYVAFVTSAGASDGSLVVWDVERATMSQVSVPAEVSKSFRDALPVRYLAWSPDGGSLAAAMNRDLYVLEMIRPNVQPTVGHREERYTLAGLVMGSIGHPTWTTDGRRILYDTFVPPDVLSADADEYRDVEYVDVSTLVTETLLEDAHIVPGQPAPGGQELMLQHDDGRVFSLNLGTLEMRETTSLPATQGPRVCLTKNGTCVSVVSDQEGYSALAFTQHGGETHRVSLEDLVESPTECQFQSTLWSPDGDSLLTTVGCPMRVGLWSIRFPDVKATHLTDWAGVGSAVLLTWFE